MIPPLRLGSLAFLLLATAVPSAIHAQCDPTLPECFDTSEDPPTVSIGHVGGEVQDETVSLTVYYSDDEKVVSPPTITLSGGAITSHQFGYDDANDLRTARSNLTLSLAGGTSVLQAFVTDDLGQAGSASVTFQYTPPPPVQRTAPLVDATVQNGVNRNLSLCDACSELVLSHSTPAYVSLDGDRSVTLFYSANHADPRGFVWLDVMDPSLDPAQTITLQLRAPDGGLVQFRTGSDTMHFTRGAGPNRIAGQFSAPTLATGSYPYTAIVTSRWSDGQQLTTDVPVRVIVINERGNAAGAGWSIAGLQRVGTQGDSAFVTSGDGHLAFFEQTGCGGDGCTYDSPPGDYTVLTQVPVNGFYGWHRRYLDGTLAVFDHTGKLLHVTDRFGNRTSYAYDLLSGQLVSITDPVGKVTQLGYASGKLRTITDPTGRVTTLTHSGTALVRIDDPTGAPVLRPTYSSAGRVTSWIDARGSTWNVGYDVAGKVATVYAPQITAEGTLLRPTTTVLTRERRALVSSTSGTATSPRAPIHPDSTWRRVTAPKGAQTVIWGDAQGLTTRVQAHDGKVTSIVRYPDGRVRLVEDPDGSVAWYSYALDDARVTSLLQRTASGSVDTEITYANYGQPATVSVDGVQATYAYDTSDRLQSVTVDSRVSSYTWDSRGRLLTFRDPDDHLTQVEYESSGAQNTFRVTSPDGTSVRYGYDAAGRQTTVTASDNTVHTTAYDVLNRATQSTSPLSLTTQFTYEGNTGDLTSVLDAKGQTHQFRYNPMGWVYEEVSPGNRVRSAEFDREGNVTKQTDPAGRVVSATYNALGRMASRTVDNVITTFGYDPNRRWVRAASSVSTDSVFFDVSSRPIRSSVTRGTARFQILHTYDAVGRRTQMGIAGPSGDTLSAAFSYDGAGRLHGIRDLLTGAEAAQAGSGGSFSANTTRFTYDSEGLVGSIGLPSSGAFSFGYTPTHQIASISIHHGLGGLDRSYEYTTRGQVLRTSSPGVDRIREFGYDGSGQLTQASDYATGEEEVCPDPMDLTACYMEPYQTLLSTTTHAWDAVGNPTDRGAVVQTGNRLTTYDGWTLQYDAAGYLISRSKSGVPSQTLAWNGLGQLTSVTTAGTGTVSFQYDGFGRRVRRTSPTGVVSQYLYDGHDLVMEMDGSGNRRRAYSHYAGIDQPHSVREFTGSAAGTYYFAMELPGHVSGLTNASGQLVNRYEYSPFGKLEYVQEGVPNPLRYMGREWDPDAGLYYVRNRWYDPLVGRFISEDPIGIEGGINVYAYVGNDPVNGRDPFGLCKKTRPDTICLKTVVATAVGCTDRTWTRGDDGVCRSPRGGGGGGGGAPSGTGGLGGGAGPGAATPPANSPGRDQDQQCAVKEITGGVSALAGGGFPGGFLGGYLGIGYNTAGQVFIQLGGSASGGVGAFAGWGFTGGVAEQANPYRSFSTDWAYETMVNAGLGPSAGLSYRRAMGASGEPTTSGVSLAPRLRVGQGWGAQVSTGVSATRTVVLFRIPGGSCR